MLAWERGTSLVLGLCGALMVHILYWPCPVSPGKPDFLGWLGMIGIELGWKDQSSSPRKLLPAPETLRG